MSYESFWSCSEMQAAWNVDNYGVIKMWYFAHTCLVTVVVFICAELSTCIRSMRWHSVTICWAWLLWSPAHNMAALRLNCAADIYIATMTKTGILSWKCQNSGTLFLSHCLTNVPYMCVQSSLFVCCSVYWTSLSLAPSSNCLFLYLWHYICKKFISFFPLPFSEPIFVSWSLHCPSVLWHSRLG